MGASSDHGNIDREVLAVLRELRVASAGRIAYKIGGTTSQAVAASLKRLGDEGMAKRAGRSRTCWEPVR